MNVEKMIKNIQNINGYRGLAILDKGGEIIHIDERNQQIDLAFSSSIFNDTFRALNEASLDVGFSNLIRLETETEEGMVFLIYSNKTYTIFTIFNPQGNISLAKMLLVQSLKKDE
jgi:predicted regulator of Ras-like GTPase activity (Roadblock/LC7/MglB family)